MAKFPAKLQVLGIGIGRDGTTTTRALIRSIYQLNREPWKAQNETQVVKIYQGLNKYIKTNDSQPLEHILKSWQHRAEVGNGFAFFMPVIYRVFGSELKLIHLQRDKKACIQSLCQRQRLYPGGWAYNHTSEQVLIHRPTAVDFEEMSDEGWNKLALEDKMSWYYDKSHQLIRESAHLFKHYLPIKTEELNRPEVLIKLTQFLDPHYQIRPAPIHVNFCQFFNSQLIASVSQRQLEALTHGLNLHQLLVSNVYPLEFYLLQLVRKYQKDKQRYRFNLLIIWELLKVLLQESSIQSSKYYGLTLELLKNKASDIQVLNRKKLASYSYLSEQDIERLMHLFQGFNILKSLRYPVFSVLFFLNYLISCEQIVGLQEDLWRLKKMVEQCLDS